MGMVLIDRGEFVEAIRYLQTALRLQPDSAQAHYHLANALVGSDQIELAIAHYHRALEIDPDHVKAHCKLANVLTDLGRPEEAMAHYEQAAAARFQAGRSQRQVRLAAGDVSQ